MENLIICDKCVCLPVCENFRATGGVTNCIYFYQKKQQVNWVAFYQKGWRDGQKWMVGYTCTNCKGFAKDTSPFCPHCGAEMKVEYV